MPAGPDVQYVSPTQVAPHIKHSNLILQSARYWYLYNTIASEFCDWTYKAEDLITVDSVFNKFCNILNITSVPEYIDMPEEHVHSRKSNSMRQTVTWTILESLDRELTDNIRAASNQWGYEIE
jgi:hypothetical protein